MSNSASSRRRRWWIVLAGLFVAVVLGSLFWLQTWGIETADGWRATTDAVFEGSVRSVSQVLDTPESPATDLAWHRVLWHRCARQASWQLGSVDPADPIGRVESVVESLTSVRLLPGDIEGDQDWRDLEGATTVKSYRGISDLWLKAGVEEDGRFRLTVYGGGKTGELWGDGC
jgi:hypothetical protein